MATAAVDVEYLSGYLSLPQETLSSVLDAPTAELVRSVLDAVTTKAREHNDLVAEKYRVDIELENAVRSSETRIEGLRTSVEKSQKTVEEVRTKLKEEENTRSSLESELQALKSFSSTSTSEVETLRTRISSLESANRDALAVLESKTTANDTLAQELQKQHQKGLELSQQITTLQQSVQNASSAASSAKFREQSLKQEAELAKNNAEWFEDELRTKSAEALKFRKEKGARIAELQRLNEDLNSNVEALKKTEQALRTRLDEMQKKAEDALSNVQQLQEAAAKAEENFRQDLERANRLTTLQTQQAETHRNRLKEVEAGFEKAKDDAAEEIGRARQEAETERHDREAFENRVSELEAELATVRIEAANRPGSVPGTPRQGLNGSAFGRSGSPALFSTPGSVRGKSMITATQAIEELYKVKGQLSAEKLRNERLSTEMEEMLQSLEAKGPEIEEMQNEYDRLQQEVVQMSKSIDTTGRECDRAKKDLRKAESEAATAKAESKILQQQLRDISAQVKLLLCEMDARERGLDTLSTDERTELERMARGEVSQEELQGLTDTDKFITEKLRVFRNVYQLQEKNMELMRIIRELGDQMESEEALAAKHQAATDHKEVENLQKKIENYKDELANMLTRSESYIKERDMFRRMLQNRGQIQIPPGSDLASMFGQSVDGNQNGVISTIEQNPGQSTNYPALLRELQQQFDNYREEQSTDRRTMKEQTERLSLDKGALQAEIAKCSSQLIFANERYEMLQANYTMLQKENNELQKRSQTLSEAAAKQDLRTQQVAEDLIEAKGLVESMRNENANLKAEKKLWKDIQDRLSQDNENLMNERTRLNNLVANQQNLQNERELSESEARRRLQAHVETLEGELATTKRKLNDEMEDNKKAQLRKEYDLQQNQKRIDGLASSLSQAREDLVAAKTTRDHLQSRVDELAIELKSAEERVGLLQPRPTPRSAPNADNENAITDEANREQELALEVSELKRDLDLAKSELESAKSQTEQYKAISQSSEEELQSINVTQDQYRDEMDRIIEEKDSKVRELQQRVDDITTELTTSNNELTLLRNQQSETARQFDSQKAILEQEIARLKDEDERHATTAQFHQQDLRAQAAIATKAQQNYENELVKHAEAAKLLQNLRAEHNQLKTEFASIKADAESSRVALSQSETSWEERRQQLEQELTELRTRRDDVNAQNKLLHQQLENVGSQISALQQNRSSLADAGDAASPSGDLAVDRTADGLRELNSFLRREKEIVEVQYELKVQEAKRLQQQLDYTQSQLDESRLKLDQERRSQADGSRSSTAHKDLMEKLNELNLFRESSITLRNEARQAQTQLAEKTRRVEELIAQIQPLETKIRELEHGKETSEGEMRLLQEDRDRWQKRTQDIISKHDRIDPAEMEQLKGTIESLKTERDALLEEKQPLQDKVQTLESEKANWQQSRSKIIDQAKEKSRIQTQQIKDRTGERDTVTQERDSLQQQVSGLRQQLEAAVREKNTAEQQLSGLREQLETAVREKNAAEQQLKSLNQELEAVKSNFDRAVVTAAQAPAGTTPAVEPSQQSTEKFEQEIAGLRKQIEEITQQKLAIELELKSLKEQLEKANSERDSAVADAAGARSAPRQSTSDEATTNGNEEGQIDETAKSGISDDEKKILEERIATAVAEAKKQEEKAAKVEELMETTLKARSEKMKNALNKKLGESREAARKEIEAEYVSKLDEEKQKWLSENKLAPVATPAPFNPFASTPSANPFAINPFSTTTLAATPSAAHSSGSEPLKIPTTPVKPKDEQVPTTPAGASTPLPKLDGLTDHQIRDFISGNPVARSILVSNVKSKMDSESRKLKDDYQKQLSELQQKADDAKQSAVFMTEKKNTLKLNMAENRAKLASGKLELVETAARDTPQKPVVEVWEVVKVWKPAPQPPAPTPEAATQNVTGLPIPKSVEIKTDTPTVLPPIVQSSGALPGQNGTPAFQPNQTSLAPQTANNQQARGSGIPTIRGGSSGRARGLSGIYQAGRGQGGAGRGRGTGPNHSQRGGMNPGAQPYSPQGQGQKRPREEGSMGGPQGNGGKRPRGGGPGDSII